MIFADDAQCPGLEAFPTLLELVGMATVTAIVSLSSNSRVLAIFVQALPLCWRPPCSSLPPDVSAFLLLIFPFLCNVDPVFDTSPVFGLLLLPTVVSMGQFPFV